MFTLDLKSGTGNVNRKVNRVLSITEQRRRLTGRWMSFSNAHSESRWPMLFSDFKSNCINNLKQWRRNFKLLTERLRLAINRQRKPQSVQQSRNVNTSWYQWNDSSKELAQASWASILFSRSHESTWHSEKHVGYALWCLGIST